MYTQTFMYFSQILLTNHFMKIYGIIVKVSVVLWAFIAQHV